MGVGVGGGVEQEAGGGDFGGTGAAAAGDDRFQFLHGVVRQGGEPAAGVGLPTARASGVAALAGFPAVSWRRDGAATSGALERLPLWGMGAFERHGGYLADDAITWADYANTNRGGLFMSRDQRRDKIVVQRRKPGEPPMSDETIEKMIEATRRQLAEIRRKAETTSPDRQ